MHVCIGSKWIGSNFQTKKKSTVSLEETESECTVTIYSVQPTCRGFAKDWSVVQPEDTEWL